MAVVIVDNVSVEMVGVAGKIFFLVHVHDRVRLNKWVRNKNQGRVHLLEGSLVLEREQVVGHTGAALNRVLL